MLVIVAGCGSCAPHPLMGVKDSPSDDTVQDYAETFAFEVSVILKELRKHVSAEDRANLRKARIVYTNEQTAFSFYVTPGPLKTIHLTAGGLVSIALSAQAAAIDHHLYGDDGWWIEYLLAERAHVSNAPLTGDSGMKLWASPQAVLGCDWVPISGDATEERTQTEYVIRMNMLSFIVAHEAAHAVLDHNPQRLKTETPAEHDERLRANELEADRWALPVLVRMRVNPFDVIRALFTHLVIFGGSEKEANIHQNDVKRIKLVRETYERYLPRKYSAIDAKIALLFSAVTPPDGVSMREHLDAAADRFPFIALHYMNRKSSELDIEGTCEPHDSIPQWIRDLSREIYRPREEAQD